MRDWPALPAAIYFLIRKFTPITTSGQSTIANAAESTSYDRGGHHWMDQ